MQINILLAYLPMLLIFGSVVLLVLGVGRLYNDRLVRSRLAEVVEKPRAVRSQPSGAASRKVAGVFDSLSQFSLPSEGWQDGELALKFVRAGFRGDQARRIYFALKTLLSLGAPLLTAILLSLLAADMPLSKIAFYSLIVAAAGYYLPDFYLRMRTSRRANEMRNTLPDLIDLLVICTESGLGLDAALNRVSREIARTSPTLAEEFYLAALEIRAGAGRATSLKNLALRVDLEDLYSLVSMLVQADKFGTSLGEALRIQSDLMRNRRLVRAEEAAAKIPVKMLMPLIFFIFPTMMFVLLGPAVIQATEVFGSR